MLRNLICLLMCLVASTAARAELFVTGTRTDGGSGFPTLFSFTDDGKYIAPVAGTMSEELGDIAVRPSDGAVFVTSNILGGGDVYGVSPSGGRLSGGFSHAIGYYGPAGLAFGPNGSLYGASNAFNNVREDAGKTAVFRYDFNGPATVFAVPPNAGSFPNDFIFSPAIGPDGHLYVGRLNQGVLRFNGTTGQYMNVFIPAEAGVGRMRFDGNVMYGVTDGGLTRFDAATGQVIDTLIPKGRGGLIGVGDYDFGPGGTIYVNDTGGRKILRFDGAGQFMDTVLDYGQVSAPVTGIRYIAYSPIPEPGAVSCVVIAGGALALRRRRGR